MAKKALITTREKRETGYKITDVVNEENQFGVDPDFLFWINCPENINENNRDKFWYDPNDNTCKLIPTTSPHTGWIFNNTTLDWEAPTPQPGIGDDGKAYYWNDETQSWIK